MYASSSPTNKISKLRYQNKQFTRNIAEELDAASEDINRNRLTGNKKEKMRVNL